ncbi:MAG: hypothetical protein RMK89_04250 [Armatimonadota bacterium]|nr:hypothetical protein [Armatimonadota bacterium]MDW8142658.1 hypothetical protein [Armatimonadota bacterium]
MKFLFISPSGDFLPVARRVKEEGNDVAVWIKSARVRGLGIYRGLLEEHELPNTLTQAFEVLGGEPDAIIFDHIGLGDLADELRQHNLPVWGASKVADKLEEDRVFGLRVMEQVGIKIPLTSPHLSSLADAQSFMRQHPDIEKWVVKFEGENAPRSTVIGEIEEVLDMLDTLLGEGEGSKFILQQFVEGVEISTEIWVSGGQIVDPANATLETKPYLAGNIGPNTGCMTSIVWAYEEAVPKIVEEGIGKMADWLEQQGFNGPIDLNSIVNDDGVWGLEWTPRHGYNAVYALFSLFDDDIGRVLADAARGQLKVMPVRTDDIAYAIRVYLPPAPFVDFFTGDILERLMQLQRRGEDVKAIAEALSKVGIEVNFKRGTGEVASVDLTEVAAGELVVLPDAPAADIWLLDVKLDRAGRLVTAGMDGIICEVSAAADRLSVAVRLCEQTVNAIRLAGKCWRNDGHLRAFDAARLSGLGYEVPHGLFR